LNPAISVILPVYNAELYLKEAIDSILNQTLSDFEFIIFNDGSTDRTDEIIRSYNDERIVYKKKQENAGYLNLLNEGLDLAQGKYIARMDADDISLPNRFKEQFSFLEKNPDVGICGSWIESIGDKTGFVKRPVSFSEIQYNFFFGCPLTHPTVMMRNEALKKFDLRYNAKYYYAEDHEFFLRCSFHFKLVNLPMVLLKYRIHSTQIGSAKWMQQAHIKNTIQSKIFTLVLMPCSTYEEEWLENFFTLQSVPSEKWIEEIDLFKNKLINENEKKSIYPHAILKIATNELFQSKIRENFYKYYYRKYYNQRKFNPGRLGLFLKEKYKPYKYLGSRLTLFFVIKCLLFYRKKI
jgi:glycosyltransferase involved in cell wall biosynthesis